MTSQELLANYNAHCGLVDQAELVVKAAKAAIKQAERDLEAAEHALWLARYDRRRCEDGFLRQAQHEKEPGK